MRMADLEWVRGGKGRAIVGGRRIEDLVSSFSQERPVTAEANRGNTDKSRGSELVRLMPGGKNDRIVFQLKNDVEQIGGQLEGVRSRIRGAEVTHDLEGKAKWREVEAQLLRLQAEKNAILDQARQQKAA